MDNRNENEIVENDDVVSETETDDSAVPAVKAEPDKNSPDTATKVAAAVFDIFEMFAICTAVILLLFSYVARFTVVEGGSMENTLHGNDYMIVQDIGYTPTRGDIVVIQNIDASIDNPIIKRVIAVEGDTVDIDASTWTVYVNGKALDEPYVNLEPGAPVSDLHTVVEEGKIFVLGDHRNHSSDSRSPLLGQVDERCVVGRAFLRVLPLDKFGIMERAEYN